MKVKLVKINFYEESDGSDYPSFVKRYFVDSYSDFEKINDGEYGPLLRWVEDYNKQSNQDNTKKKYGETKHGDYYVLITDGDVPIRFAIEQQVEKEKKLQELERKRKEKEEAERSEKEKQRLAKLAQSKQEKLEKKLAKIQKQLEEEKARTK
jgi:hypothetical protein